MRGLFRRKWVMMLLGAIVGAGVGFSVTLAVRPGYRAQCLLETVGETDADALVLKLLRPSLSRSVAEELSRDNTFYGSSLDVRRSLSGEKVADNLVRLRCVGPEPLVCERVLTLLLDEYREGLLERGAREADERVRLIRSRISEYRKAAGAKEEELNDLLRKYRWLADYGDREEGIVAAYGNMERANADNARELAKLEKEEAAARKKREKIKARLDKEEEYVVTELVKEVNPDIIDLNTELLALQKQLRQYLVDSSEEHPTVKRLRKEIGSTKKMIDEKPKEIIKEQKVSVNPTYRALKDDLFRAGGELEKIESRHAKLRREVEKYEQVKRDIPPGEWKRAVELEEGRGKALERLETERARLATIRGKSKDEGIMAVEFSVIDPPTSEEVIPDRRLFIGVGALIGLLLGAVLPGPGKKTGA